MYNPPPKYKYIEQIQSFILSCEDAFFKKTDACAPK